MKILAVDDDQLILKLLQETMFRAGFDDVTLARSAEEAAVIVAEANPPFDCMLIDIKMPEIDGDHLCRWIRHLPNYVSTPIIMVTALLEKSDIDRAFAAGATDYITKPIVLSELISRVKQIAHQSARDRLFAENTTRKTVSGGLTQELDRTDFMKPLKVGEIEGEIEIIALENYLLQLSRIKTNEMSAFSFVIKDAAKLHLVSARNEFHDVLRAMGKAISKHLRAPHLFISYAGYGVFVGVMEGKSIDGIERDLLEETVQQSFEGTTIASKSGAPMKIELIMSIPKPLGKWSGLNVVDVLYRTIGDAEERCKYLRAVA